MGEIDVEALYIRYGPMVIRRCRYLLCDEELALDASQEVFMKLWQNKEQLAGDSNSGLLLQIATNTCLNTLRSIKRRREDAGDGILEAIADAEDSEEGILARMKLDHIFSREHPTTRLIALMHYYDGLTLEQVAREVGLSVSGVRKRLNALRHRAQGLKGIFERE